MSRTLLLDGDIFAYQIASSAEVPIHWGDDLWTLHSDFGPARVKIEERFKALQDRLEADEFIVAFSDAENFRRGVYPYYKANRVGKRKVDEEKVKTGGDELGRRICSRLRRKA